LKCRLKKTTSNTFGPSRKKWAICFQIFDEPLAWLNILRVIRTPKGFVLELW
jgi:hypothetical protein